MMGISEEEYRHWVKKCADKAAESFLTVAELPGPYFELHNSSGEKVWPEPNQYRSGAHLKHLRAHLGIPYP